MKSISIDKSNVIFYNKLSEMPINQLKTEITDDIPNNYDIAVLEIEKVLNHIYEGQGYKNFKLNDKMIRLINFIKEGHKIIPPIIRYVNNDSWTIYDGQHRIGLFIYLNIPTVPFLIRKDQVKYIYQLK